MSSNLLFHYARREKSERECPNCGRTLKDGEGHYVPPSLGEEGFYVCQGLVDNG